MSINEYLAEHGISRYRLSKLSGIPWATLSDLCAGKTKLERCSGTTLKKLASALEISMEELLQMDTEPATDVSTGLPKDKAYLETGLPESLRKAIDDYGEGEKSGSTLLDCLWGELYGSINAQQYGGRISKEQADFLREKYLFL